MKILFQPNQVLWESAPGESILQAAERANVLIDASCAGTGTCGKCKVRVISGTCSPMTENEKARLSPEEIRLGYRLACKTIPEDDLVVELPGIHKGSSRKKNMAALPADFVFAPTVKKELIHVEKASMKNQHSDQDRLLEALNNKTAYLDHRLMGSIHKLTKRSGNKLTVVLDRDRIMALEAGDTRDQCYGLAVDIGTTTAVSMLWDLNSCKNIAVAARTNPQSIYGADVVSRIQYCNEAEDHLEKMHRKVIDCVNDMIEEMTVAAGIDPQNIYDVTVVGNTTMSHLFLNVHPQPLARTPFAPVFCLSQDRTAQELKLHVSPLANVHFLPNIAGHVGADISSVLLATGLKTKKGIYVAIDIGTNGEILLANNGKVLACSTAAGPAFEGAQIYMGMRAADGAIEKVTIEEDDLLVKTIEDEPAIGICGSGLIDAVACLLQAGVVDPAGRMLSRVQAERSGVAPKIAARIIEHDKKPAVILAFGENEKPIILTQDDIREVQLAKGAIRAGVSTMMRLLGIADRDLDQVMLAGAFGNYINKASAARIGLLPDVQADRVISIGNAAGVGACMALLSGKQRSLVDEQVKDIEHVELSCNEVFQDEYIMAMGFPKPAFFL